MHLEKQTQSHPAMIHMLSNPQCTHRMPPYAQVLQKTYEKCVYFHKNTLYVKYKVFLILLHNRSLKNISSASQANMSACACMSKAISLPLTITFV